MEQKLAHYQIEDQLGEGSFAWVYRAFDEKFERPVALKVLKPAWLSDPQAIARFQQEAKTMAKLRHAHIVDVGDAEGQIYLAQLLVEGETLADRLNSGPLAWAEVVKIVTAIPEPTATDEPPTDTPAPEPTDTPIPVEDTPTPEPTTKPIPDAQTILYQDDFSNNGRSWRIHYYI